MEVPEFVARRTKKWNRVKTFVMNPCNATLAVYVETLYPAAVKAVVTLVSFGLGDVVRGMTRPKGLYKNAHTGRRRRKGTSVGIPEMGEEIGKRLPGADAIKSRTYGNVEKYLWLADGVGQRVLFWVMVADIVTDFVYDWTSGIYKQDFCNKTGTSQYLIEGMTWSVASPFVPQWQGGGGGVLRIDSNTLGSSPNSRSMSDGRPHSAMAQWTFTTPTFFGLECDVGISVGTSPNHIHVSMGANESLTLTLSASGGPGQASTFLFAPGNGSMGTARCDVFSIM